MVLFFLSLVVFGAPLLSHAFFGCQPRVPWALAPWFSLLNFARPVFFFLPSFCAPVVSGFLWFLALGALHLGAVCCSFCWPPASRLSVCSRLVCLSCLAVGHSLVVAAPHLPPLFVSRGFRPRRSVPAFFSLPFSFCAPVVSGFLWILTPGAAGFRAVFCLICSPPARGSHSVLQECKQR